MPAYPARAYWSKNLRRPHSPRHPLEARKPLDHGLCVSRATLRVAGLRFARLTLSPCMDSIWVPRNGTERIGLSAIWGHCTGG